MTWGTIINMMCASGIVSVIDRHVELGFWECCIMGFVFMWILDHIC